MYRLSVLSKYCECKDSFHFFLLSVVERNPPVLVVNGDRLFCEPFHTDVGELNLFLLLWIFEKSIPGRVGIDTAVGVSKSVQPFLHSLVLLLL